ncbi:short-chain dehydrogenase [Streptomyces sp. GBA 94-10 4N24]|nr:short-chain dehydrogenase [Streptomyces sp. GBA 94-10 4N24]UYM25187.1 hypothetical protein NQP46_24310 [Streptomyces albus]UZN58673.1 short-chain dehydrogenase [Streptomyces sp. GBA 94-10 4N24]
MDVVVRNAGHMALGAAEASTTEQLADLYDVNVLGSQRVNRGQRSRLRGRRPRPRRLPWPYRTGQPAHRRQFPVTPH